MSNVVQLASKECFGFNQELERIEEQMAKVRLFRGLSLSQRQRVIHSENYTLIEAFGRIALEAAEAYDLALRSL